MGPETNSCSITQFDERENRFLSAVVAVGPLADMLNFPPREQGGEAWYVARQRKALYIESEDQLPREIPELNPGLRETGVRSSAALPLIRHNRLIGVLFIHEQQPTLFSPELRRALETYANQAAIAIENARQYELRSRDIAALQSINEALVSQDPRVLNLIVNQALSVMPAEYCSLWMEDQETGDLILRAFQGPPDDLYFPPRPDDRRLKAGVPNISMEVFQSGRAIMVPDVNQEPSRYRRFYLPSRSQLTVPLKYRDQTIGTLNVESRYVKAFDEENARLLDSFADQAAIAIKVAQGIEELSKANKEIQKQKDKLSRANDRLERRNASFEALTEIGQQLTSNIQRSEREILSIIHQQASQIMDTGNMYIALFEPEKDLVYFEIAFLDGTPVDIENEKDWGPRSGGHGRTEWIIRHKTPILTYTKMEAEQWYQQLHAQNYINQTFASWLGVPLMYGDEALGVIATYHKTEEFKYDPDDLKILTFMGRQAAIALQNARLIRQLDRRIVELDTLRELGEDLSKSALSV
jgi:GAF domain-containing protein